MPFLSPDQQCQSTEENIFIYHNHANHSDAEAGIVEVQVAQHVFENTNCLATGHFPQCVYHLPHGKLVSQLILQHIDEFQTL